MIKEIQIKDFGPIKDLHASNLGNINLVIGKNGSGKTYLLKTLFAAKKATEQFGRGNDNHTIKELLSDNLRWTFQTNSLSELVNKGAQKLEFLMGDDKNYFSFEFGTSTTKEVGIVDNNIESSTTNCIFLPAKEILSLQNIILQSRDYNKEFGFDETYYDLAKALRPATQGRNTESLSKARKNLREAIGGKIEYDEKKKEWYFKQGNKKFDINITSEGIKKISILDSLLGNHYLNRDSVIFIDEAESNLHPELIEQFMEIIFILAKDGYQFFISTHNYFVIKKLYILAHKNNMSVPTLSFTEEGVLMSDLKYEMPNNPIIDASIKLYKDEIAL